MIEDRDRFGSPRPGGEPSALPDGAGAPILLAESRVCAAGEGAHWVAEGWRLFKSSWDVLLGIVVLQWLVTVVAATVPLLGNLAVVILGPVFSAGLLIAIRSADLDERPELGMMFAGFTSPRFQSLVMLGVAQLLGSLLLLLAVGLPAAIVVGLGFMHGQTPDPPTIILEATGLAIVFGGALFVYAGLFWFALPLVLFHGIRIPEAMRLSLRGLLRNWAALTVYGAIGLGLGIAAGLTLFLAMLVVAPLMSVAYYRSYRAIYTAT